jgi:hypothetical protein
MPRLISCALGFALLLCAMSRAHGFAPETSSAGESLSNQKQNATLLDSAKQHAETKPAPPDSARAFSFSRALNWLEQHALLVGAILLPLMALLWSLLTGQSHLPRFKKWLEGRTLKRRYVRALREEHETINLLGFQAVSNLPVRTLEVFVSLRLAEASHREMHAERFELEENRVLTPEDTLRRAFFGPRKTRLLLILWDPGSGKTTLLKYTMPCAASIKPDAKRSAWRNSSCPSSCRCAKSKISSSVSARL